jgi:hypothetical protein
MHLMSPSKERIVTFRVSPELAAAMEELHERHGTPFSEQCRRALEAWLRDQGVLKGKADRLRGDTRKRP